MFTEATVIVKINVGIPFPDARQRRPSSWLAPRMGRSGVAATQPRAATARRARSEPEAIPKCSPGSNPGQLTRILSLVLGASLLAEVKAEIRRRRCLPIPDQGRWLAAVVRGHQGRTGTSNRRPRLPPPGNARERTGSRAARGRARRGTVVRRRTGSPGMQVMTIRPRHLSAA
jgi:hypothetical protein